MPLLIFPILLIATVVGRRLNRIATLGDPADISSEERTVFGLATGLGVIAYSVLLIGLFGFLSPVPVAIVLVGLAAFGLSEYPVFIRELVSGIKRLSLGSPAAMFAVAICVLFLSIALVGCWVPPTGAEYDSLCYHLADPKIYIRLHRIVPLPWESHSNFAFTMEMLYTIGLLGHSIALAKLFHWTTAAIAVLATYQIGRRVAGNGVGLAAATMLASLPLVLWEAGTAYVDMGATAFGALGLLAVIGSVTQPKSETSPEFSRWLRLSAMMMGWMISTKATSLVPAALYLLILAGYQYVVTRDAKRLIGSVGAYSCIAGLVGCVWYLKSWIVTGNPVYPFAYSLFGGRHWSAGNAAMYASSQNAFGMGHKPADLLLSPWNLTMYLAPGHVPPDGGLHPFNDSLTIIDTLTPLFLCVLFVPIFVRSRTPQLVKVLSALALVSVAIWFVLTQQVRYLLPTMPLFCLVTAYWLVRLVTAKAVAGYALLAIAGCSLTYCGWVALLLMANDVPLLFGQESRSAYIARGFPAYPAMQYLNIETATNDGVVFYGEPRDFYCDRPYIWGEPGHGLYVPYDSMHSSGDLKTWFLSHGIDYIYVDGAVAHFGPGDNMNGFVYGLTDGSGHEPVYTVQGTQIEIYALA